jgi:hypothetical protein
MKALAWVLAVLLLTGCTAHTSRASATTATAKSPPTEIAPSQPATTKPTPEPVQATSEAAQILIQFAQLVTTGDVQGAAHLLAPSLRGVYQFNDYAPLHNTPRMEIVRLVERTGDPAWHPDVGTRDQKVAEARVFALDVRYKVLGSIESYFKDGEVYHHKATVTRYTTDGPWLISELSGRGN